ncbi:MAG: hypothetical protein J7516_13545, partial [Shinella sp.]|nr:hypothetical protein [Shinella sp.]
MARDPNGKITGTSGNDVLWGTALVLGDGTYDNASDMDSANHKGAIRGYGGNDTIFGSDAIDIIYGGAGSDQISA